MRVFGRIKVVDSWVSKDAKFKLLLSLNVVLIGFE